VSIERCGATCDGTYADMHGNDISDYNAKIDCLFYEHSNTIGIGDGGNEIGMGNFASIIPQSGRLTSKPSVTKATHAIIATVSNWGAYGLIAEIAKRVNQNVLLSVNDGEELIRRAVVYGAVDGVSKKREPGVDGFRLLENSKKLSMLHQYIKIKMAT
jgi:hypothetical protein